MNSKRYNLVLPEELFNAVQAVAKEEGTAFVTVLKRFLRLGLVATEAMKKHDGKLLLKQGANVKEIFLL